MDVNSLDQFESVFKRSYKTRFKYKAAELNRILVITGSEEKRSAEISQITQKFLKSATRDANWQVIHGGEITDVKSLLKRCQDEAPDLIITYRNLKQPDRDLPYGLGSYLVALTQGLHVPIMILPYFTDDTDYSKVMLNTNSVTVMAGHIEGHDDLINLGVCLTEPNGRLHVTHFEDKRTFEYYINAISKIPQLDTDIARAELADQLLRQPQNYLEQCIEVLSEARPNIEVVAIVQMAETLAACQQHIRDNQVDLLIMQSKDEDQLAMNGIAYTLGVELKQVPLLLV